MTWHSVLITAETAFVWSTVAGLVACVFAWRPVRRLLHLLDADSPGGLGTITDAIRDAGPPPGPPGRDRGRS